MDHLPKKNSLDPIDGLLYIDGLFFITKDLIQKDDPLISETIHSLYKTISNN